MNRDEFNEKWKKRLESGFNGCMIQEESIINYIDTRFEEFAKDYPDFTYSQIKNKFGRLVIYVEGVPEEYQDKLLNGMKL